MDESKKELLKTKNETIIGKILNFFRGIFRKNSNKKESTIKVKKPYTASKFKSELKEQVTEEEEIRRLQRLFHERKIKEEELTVEQKEKIIKLYDIRINELKRKIENIKNQILK